MIIAYKAIAALLLCLGLYFAGHHVGASSVQAKWDAQKHADAIVAAQVEAASVQHAKDLAGQFSDLSTKYQAIVHEKVPAISDAIPAAVADGSLRLRDNAVCPGQVSAVTARSRAADAATTQALADRVSHSIMAIRAGEAADARERQLDAQITSLQDILSAERR